MGPPLKAAENTGTLVDTLACRSASMGPPLKAAENSASRNTTVTSEPKLQWGRR